MIPPPRARILALGLVEASWTCVRDLSLAAPAAFLTRMESEGARGITVASQPLDHAALWATLVTGRSAGAHGVFGQVRPNGHGLRRVLPDDLAVPPIWSLLEDAGIPAGTFNMLLTDPKQSSTGFNVSRDERPEIHPNLVQPPTLYPQLTERFGQWTTTTKARAKSDWTSLVPDEIEIRAEVLSDLLRTRPWSFAMAHLLDVAFAQHRFWSDGTGTLQSICVAVDRAIAKIVEAAGPETLVFVFSECGAGPIRHGIHLNTWLEREGYLHQRIGPVQRLGSSLAGAHKRAKRFLPQTLDFSRFKRRVQTALLASSFDWSRTRAFSPGASNEIVFNVPSYERAALVHDLSSRLLALRDPEGRRVVEEVIPRDSWRTHGSFTPDLTVVWDDDAYMPIEGFDKNGRIFVDWGPQFSGWTFTGSHRREGMLLASGPGIERVDLGKVRTVDFVPTWLELLGVDIPRECEGSSFAAKLFKTSGQVQGTR